MDSPHERTCPSCSAGARADQRWCLDCGAELPRSARRSGIGPAIGIATTVAVLLGAGTAGGYSLLQDGPKAPPPPVTVAQTPPPPPPVTEPEDGPAPSGDLPSTDLPSTEFDDDGAWEDDEFFDDYDDGEMAPPDDEIPDLLDDFDDGEPNPPPPDEEAPDLDDGGGAITDGGGRARTRRGSRAGGRRAARPARPTLRETNIALGSVAVVLAPDGGDADLGDASAIVDGAPKTAWRTPPVDDPATAPGVGVYVDLASSERLTGITVRSPTPGMTVELYGATKGPPNAVPAPGWRRLATETVDAATAIDLPRTARYRFILVWVTALPADARFGAISELEIFSVQPE